MTKIDRDWGGKPVRLREGGKEYEIRDRSSGGGWSSSGGGGLDWEDAGQLVLWLLVIGFIIAFILWTDVMLWILATGVLLLLLGGIIYIVRNPFETHEWIRYNAEVIIGMCFFFFVFPATWYVSFSLATKWFSDSLSIGSVIVWMLCAFPIIPGIICVLAFIVIALILEMLGLTQG